MVRALPAPLPPPPRVCGVVLGLGLEMLQFFGLVVSETDFTLDYVLFCGF